jgi:hypothetical protein
MEMSVSNEYFISRRKSARLILFNTSATTYEYSVQVPMMLCSDLHNSYLQTLIVHDE